MFGGHLATYSDCLAQEDYAHSMENQEEHAWVLLGKPPPAEPAGTAMSAKAKGKQKATPASAGPSTAATCAAPDLGNDRATRPANKLPEQAAGPAPLIDLTKMSATRLAELQVSIAHQLQGAREEHGMNSFRGAILWAPLRCPCVSVRLPKEDNSTTHSLNTLVSGMGALEALAEYRAHAIS